MAGGGERLRAGADERVVADVRDAGGLRVEALRVGADHRLVEPAGAALVERAVLVDERVVADVVPAVRVAVVAADREHDLRRLLRRVVVQRDGVVHVDRLHRPVVRRRRAARSWIAPQSSRETYGNGVVVAWAARTFAAGACRRPRSGAAGPARACRAGTGPCAPARPRPGPTPPRPCTPRCCQRPQPPARRTRSSTSGVARPRQRRPTRLNGARRGRPSARPRRGAARSKSAGSRRERRAGRGPGRTGAPLLRRAASLQPQHGRSQPVALPQEMLQIALCRETCRARYGIGSGPCERCSSRNACSASNVFVVHLVAEQHGRCRSAPDRRSRRWPPPRTACSSAARGPSGTCRRRPSP